MSVSLVGAPAHSKLGASSAYRWFACPGSVRLSQGIDSEESSYAAEGTRAHEAAAHYLEKGEFPKGTSLEMTEALMVYINSIYEDERSIYGKSGIQSFTEHRLDLSSLHPTMFGTADRIGVYPSLKLLRVYDLKFGAGIPVEVADNTQLKYYALGALLEFGKDFGIVDVEVIIVQPRCSHPDGPVRRWRTTATELEEFATELVINAMRTEEPNAELVSGGHCRFCPAKSKCPELKNLAVRSAQAEFAPLLQEPHKGEGGYNPTELAMWLGKLTALETFIEGIRAFAYQEAMHGRTPPGHKLVAKRATRDWKPEVTESTFVMEFGLTPEQFEERKPVTFKSPAALEKLLSKEDKKRMPEFTVSESSGLTLVPESDKRPVVKTDAASEFQKLPAAATDQSINPFV